MQEKSFSKVILQQNKVNGNKPSDAKKVVFQLLIHFKIIHSIYIY